MSNCQLTISICDVITTVPGDQSHGKFFRNVKFHFIEVKFDKVLFVKVGVN